MKRTFLFSLLLTTTVLSVFAQPGTKYDIGGKWYAYNAEGKRQKALDFTIFWNDDVEAYYAKYDAIFLEVAKDDTRYFNEEHANVIRTDMSKLSFDSDSSFTLYKWHQYIIKDARNKRWIYQEYFNYFSCNCSLRFIPGKNKLVGTIQYSRIIDATGDSDYKTVQEAVKNGHGKVYQDCDGDCGEMDVVYRRQ